MLELKLKKLPPKISRIFIHPAAEIAPALEGEAFDALCDFIKRYGQLDTILAVRVPEADGKVNGTIAVLNGQANLQACEREGVEPKISIYSGNESVAELSASINLLRPHLSISQRACAGVLLEQRFTLEAKARMSAGGGDRKSGLAKLPNPIPDSKTQIVAKNAPEKLVEGKNHTQTWHQLNGLSRAALEEKYRRLFPDQARDYMDDWSKVRFVEAITNKMFSEPTPPDPAVIHSRDKAARICCVSSRSIGEAKIILENDDQLFKQVFCGKLNLGQARSEIRRNVKRVSMAPLRRTAPVAIGQPTDGITTGDSLKILPTLPRQKFRLIFADPQYNIGIDYGKGSKCDQLPDSEYNRITAAWIAELPELLTPDGAVCILINDEHAAQVWMELDRVGLKMRSWIKWYEGFGVNCQDKFNRTSRHILYFVRDPKRFVFHHDVFNRPSARQTTYGDKRANPAGKLLDDVWTDIPRLTGTCTERIPDFPTQLPLKLLQRLILGFTDEGDLVLDPFSGSGTTAAAAKMSGRNYLGIEINPTYAELSRARLQRIKSGVKP